MSKLPKYLYCMRDRTSQEATRPTKLLHQRCALPPTMAQVISTNAVIHVSQSEVLSILAVNGYARATVDPALLGCPLRGGDSDWGWASFR